GYPTQTVQETIDSLEMVRQMFEAGVLKSAYWHRFAMTAHSPVGLEPEKYMVVKNSDMVGAFANNDIEFTDPTGADHDSFDYGLKKSLLNYMHGACFDYPLHKWFDFKVPKTTVPNNYIANALEDGETVAARSNAKVVWLGRQPSVELFVK